MINEETSIVPSQYNPDKKYQVTHHEGWSCTCPDFQKKAYKVQTYSGSRVIAKFKEKIGR